MQWIVSGDEGESWSSPQSIAFPKGQLSPIDPVVPENWIVWQAPQHLGDGSIVSGFTRWASRTHFPNSPNGDLFQLPAEAAFLRFEGFDNSNGPLLPTLRLFPTNGIGLRVDSKLVPSTFGAQEPSIIELSDGRIVCVMRNLNGTISWSQSIDKLRTWSTPQDLVYRDGNLVKQPTASCPIYSIGGGNYILLHFNNDGTANGGGGPYDYLKNRRPLYISKVSESLDSKQPIAISEPILALDNGGVPDGGRFRTEMATYPSLFIDNTDIWLWYPDRKHYLLGKRLNNLLGLAQVPRAPLSEIELEAAIDNGYTTASGVSTGSNIDIGIEPTGWRNRDYELIVRALNNEGQIETSFLGEVEIADQNGESGFPRRVQFLPTYRGIKYIYSRFMQAGSNTVSAQRIGSGPVKVSRSIDISDAVSIRTLTNFVQLKKDSNAVVGLSIEVPFRNQIQWWNAEEVSISNRSFEEVSTNQAQPFLGWTSVPAAAGQSYVSVEENLDNDGVKCAVFNVDQAGAAVSLIQRCLVPGQKYLFQVDLKRGDNSSGFQSLGSFSPGWNVTLSEKWRTYKCISVSTNQFLLLSRRFVESAGSKIFLDNIRLWKIHPLAGQTNSVLDTSVLESGRKVVFGSVSNHIGSDFSNLITVEKYL
jgi:hypothetical protein